MYASTRIHDFGFLGAVGEQFEITGTAEYSDGQPKLIRSNGQCLSFDQCEDQLRTGIMSGNPSVDPKVTPVRCAPSPLPQFEVVDGKRRPMCWETIREEQIWGNTVGWLVYVPRLIEVTGGWLPGTVVLTGSIPELSNGETVTLRGNWPGTKPNNLMFGQPWVFDVAASALSSDPAAGPEEATEPAGPPLSTGALTDTVEDQEELVEVRLLSIAASQGEEAAAEAKAQYVEQREREAEATQAAHAGDALGAGRTINKKIVLVGGSALLFLLLAGREN